VETQEPVQAFPQVSANHAVPPIKSAKWTVILTFDGTKTLGVNLLHLVNLHMTIAVPTHRLLRDIVQNIGTRLVITVASHLLLIILVGTTTRTCKIIEEKSIQGSLPTLMAPLAHLHPFTQDKTLERLHQAHQESTEGLLPIIDAKAHRPDLLDHRHHKNTVEMPLLLIIVVHQDHYLHHQVIIQGRAHHHLRISEPVNLGKLFQDQV
jgi:hypothetical protein